MKKTKTNRYATHNPEKRLDKATLASEAADWSKENDTLETVAPLETVGDVVRELGKLPVRYFEADFKEGTPAFINEMLAKMDEITVPITYSPHTQKVLVRSEGLPPRVKEVDEWNVLRRFHNEVETKIKNGKVTGINSRTSNEKLLSNKVYDFDPDNSRVA